MIVVSDTSPVRALAHVDCLQHLGRLFPTVLVPPLVVDELVKPGRRSQPILVANLPFFRIEAPVEFDRIALMSSKIHAPEAQALALALEQNVDLVMIDEAEGRRIARKLGLSMIGALGVLVRMRQQNWIGELKPVIISLRDNLDFRMSPALISSVLRSVGESPD